MHKIKIKPIQNETTTVSWTWTGETLPSKKNSKQIRRKRTKRGKYVPFITSSDAYAVWNVLFVNDIKKLNPIQSWVRATFTFYPPDNRKFDLSNKYESIADGMVDAAYIKDDSYVYCPDVRLIFG
jgi:Holliday junction resolvase RusA-like endonuclease